MTRVGFILIILLCGVPSAALGHEPHRPVITGDSANGRLLHHPALKTTASHLPYLRSAIHNVGNLETVVTNYGRIGFAIRLDTFGVELLARYPRMSSTIHQVPSFLIGAILGRDTLVSRASEFFPLPEAAQVEQGDTMRFYSIADDVYPNPARSEQDIVSVYYDTVFHPNYTSLDPVDLREHRPLGLKIEQASYAWSFPFVDDFILFDYRITNVGTLLLSQLYLGIASGGSIVSGVTPNESDDICGLLRHPPAFTIGDCGRSSASGFDILWSADNDGNPNTFTGVFDVSSVTAVMGLRLLRPSDDFRKYSYNWWWHNSESNNPHYFGPQRVGTPLLPFRNFADGNIGKPSGDRDMYYVMSSDEVDYDLVFSALDHSASGWLPPLDSAGLIADGGDVSSILSVGPFDLEPGESIPLTFAWVGGENFHTSAINVSENWDPLNPQKYIDNLDYSELIKNATWAGWVYDNPGVDTDGNGYKGEFRVCDNDSLPVIVTNFTIDSNFVPPETTFFLDTVGFAADSDTVYYTGDNTPDFRAAAPPPTPVTRVTPSLGRLTIEWNGLESENTPDIFTQILDFEGYRVYIGLTPRRSDMTLLSSYDIEDYTQFFFLERYGIEHPWVVIRKPFSKREAQIAYGRGSSRYDPLVNGIDNPIHVGDSTFYFARQDYNQSNLSDTTAMHKIYPDAPRPHTLDLDKAYTEDTWHTDSLTGASVFYEGGELTPDGKWFKFFEYRLTLDNLLPSQPYFVAVTAFDFGSPGTDLGFLETNPTSVAIEALAMDRVDSTIPDGLNVIVYPNPYRIDGGYAERGFEGRGREDLFAERNRLINFTNLPPQCDIKIYSLDGDLVRQIIHDKSPDDPSSMHDTWNVITRNLQVPVSGIYYFVVETPDGRTQIGKIVLIM